MHSTFSIGAQPSSRVTKTNKSTRGLSSLYIAYNPLEVGGVYLRFDIPPGYVPLKSGIYAGKSERALKAKMSARS